MLVIFSQHLSDIKLAEDTCACLQTCLALCRSKMKLIWCTFASHKLAAAIAPRVNGMCYSFVILFSALQKQGRSVSLLLLLFMTTAIVYIDEFQTFISSLQNDCDSLLAKGVGCDASALEISCNDDIFLETCTWHKIVILIKTLISSSNSNSIHTKTSTSTQYSSRHHRS